MPGAFPATPSNQCFAGVLHHVDWSRDDSQSRVGFEIIGILFDPFGHFECGAVSWITGCTCKTAAVSACVPVTSL